MSLLSRRRPLLDSSFKKRDRNEEGTLSQRKPVKKRPFTISKTELGFITLGGSKDSSTGTFKLLPSSSSTSSSSRTSSSKKSSNAFTPIASSTSVTISSTGFLYSERSQSAQEALDSSKLSKLASGGPVEATPMVGKRKIKRSRKDERNLTKGSAWFNMAKAEITKDKKNDLEALKLRSAMEGVLHYKRNNITHTPKYFHVGTVVENSADFYSSRIPKKQRKKTLAQEFAADFGME